VAAVGIGPSDCTLGVAHHVTSAALETVLVVEQDAAITCGNEQVGWATRHTFLGCAGFADIVVDLDVGTGANSELDCRHPVFEADSVIGPNAHAGSVYDEAEEVLTATVSKPMPPRGRCVSVTVTL